jgi:hypothetical protein
VRQGLIVLTVLLLLMGLTAACAPTVRFASSVVQDGSKARGIVYYVGGAGPVGHVGFLSVPRGMQDAGFDGYVEVFTWQGFGAAVDQINLSRNRGKAMELAEKIRRDRRQFPDAPVNIIALSAGAGIATFALEYLPENVHVHNVAFLGCSLSSRYDLTRALKRIDGRLFVFHSANDIVLTRIVPYTGTVDRGEASDGVAGLTGFRLPSRTADDTMQQYAKVLNIPYLNRFASAGYRGGHIDSTSRDFIAEYVAPLILDRESDLPSLATSPTALNERRAAADVSASHSPTRGNAPDDLH